MAKTIKENVKVILELLSRLRDEKGENTYFAAKTIADETELIPTEINDAVTILVESGHATWMRGLGTAPYHFSGIRITPRGRYEVERISAIDVEKEIKASKREKPEIKPPIPKGSPYGFTKDDWHKVAEDKNKSNVLIVTFVYQFQSEHYDPDWLKKNIKKMFEEAVKVYNSNSDFKITLDFRPLKAGYGEHLFNQIARDIISADIAVFETSDKNTNVYLEMGVALTWGVAVFPIKKVRTEEPASDISGQTYADYENDGQHFVIEEKNGSNPIDPNQQKNLLVLIDRTIRKKIR